jgi:hypothetical protein
MRILPLPLETKGKRTIAEIVIKCWGELQFYGPQIGWFRCRISRDANATKVESDYGRLQFTASGQKP